MAYPSSIDSDTPSAGTTLVATDDHSNRHNVIGSAVIILETKVGLGSGSAALNQILVGSGAGTSSWGSVWNNATLGTPSITGGTVNNITGTINNAVFGTPSVAGGTLSNVTITGTLNNVSLGSPSITGGTANNLVLGTPTILAWNGWESAPDIGTVAGTTANQGTITVATGATTKYDIGDKLMYTQGGTTMYQYITSVPNGTTIIVNGGSDFPTGTTAITSAFYSKASTPNGFPGFFNFSPTWTGFSANPTGGVNRFYLQGKAVHILISPTNAGASNATSTTITNLPVISTITNDQLLYCGLAFDNGSYTEKPGRITITASSTTVTFGADQAATAWTASGNKLVAAEFWYTA